MAETNRYDHPDKPLRIEESAKVVHENFRRSLTEYMDKGVRDKYKAFYKAYRSYSDIQDDGSVSNLSVPLIPTHVDSFYARLVGMRPVVEVWPREPNDVQRAAKMRSLIDYQWDVMNMLLKAAELAKSGLIYGLAWGKCTWRREVRRRLVVEPRELNLGAMGLDLGPFEEFLQGLPSGLDEQVRDIPVWDNPYFEVIPPDQVYPDPDGTCEDSCRYLIHRTRMSLDTLEAMVKGGSIQVNKAAVGRLKEKLKTGSLLNDDVTTTLQQDAADTFDGAGDSALPEDPTKREFRLLEHWTDERVRWLCSAAPEVGLLRNEEHALNMKPLVRFTPEPLPNELGGTSLPERLYSIWLEMNALKNARMDNVFRTVHPQIMVPFGVPYQMSHLRFQAGGRFRYDPQNPPAFFQYPELKIASYREMDALERMADKVGGTSIFRGESPEGDTTATEASLLSQASGTKFGAMLQQMNEQPFKRLGRIMVRLNELNVSEARMIRVKGKSMVAVPEEFERITPQDLTSTTGAELDVTIDVAQKDPDTRLLKQRRSQEAFAATASAAQADPVLFPLQREMAIRMAEYLDISDARALVEQGQEALAQQQAAMQQQAAAGGGGQPGMQQTMSEGDQLAADNQGGLVS